MADVLERLIAPAMLVLVLASAPALFWGLPAYTDRYGEPVEASYDGPCERYATRRSPLTTFCDANLVGADGARRSGVVTDNLGEPLPRAPSTVAARARGDLARTRMSGVELWGGLIGPPLAAVALLVVLATVVPAAVDAVRSLRDLGDDADAVPTRRT